MSFRHGPITCRAGAAGYLARVNPKFVDKKLSNRKLTVLSKPRHRRFDRIALVSPDDGPHTVNIYAMLQPWIEGTGIDSLPADGATWQTSDGINSWGGIDGFNALNGGGQTEAAAASVGSAILGTTPGQLYWISLDSLHIQQLLRGSQPNYGWLLQSQSESTQFSGMSYASSDNGTAAYRPVLEITTAEPLAVSTHGSLWLSLGVLATIVVGSGDRHGLAGAWRRIVRTVGTSRQCGRHCGVGQR